MILAPIVVKQNSSWIVEDSDFETSGAASGALCFGYSSTAVSAGSLMAVDRCTFSCPGVSAIAFASQPVTITGSSEWRIAACIVTAALSGLSLSLSSVAVASLSSWVVVGCTIFASGGSAISLVSSPVAVSGGSAFVLSSNELSAVGSNKPGVAIDGKSPVRVTQSSLWMLRNTTVHSTSTTAPCFSVVAGVTLDSGGAARLLDNVCENGASCFAMGDAGGGVVVLDPDSRGAASAFLVRCNTAAGVAQQTFTPGSPPKVLLCDQCNVVADCFYPLTTAQAFRKVDCENPHGRCQCNAACGGSGDLCLPGAGTYGLPSSSSCSNAGQGTAWPNLGVTRTVTTLTRTVTATQSSSIQLLARASRQTLSAALTTLLSGSVVLSGSSVASALQKSQAQQALNGCGGGANLGPADFASSPTQMQLGSDAAANVRGLVVGNLLVWLACGTAAAMAPVVVQLVRRQQGKRAERLAVVAGLLALPGKLVVPYSMLVVPSVTGATQLLVLGASVGLAWFSIGVCISGLAVVVAVTAVSFRALAVPAKREECVSVRHRFRQLFLPQVEWVDRSRRRSSAGFVARWGPLFDAYVPPSPWFQAVELGAAIATAVLAGLVPLDGDAAMCGNLQIASCLVSFAFVVAVLARRPYSAPFDLLFAVLNAGLTALSAVLGLVGVDTTDVSNAQIGLNFVGTVAFLLSFVLEGNACCTLHEHLRRLLKASGRRANSASERNEITALSSVFLQQALAENGMTDHQRMATGDRLAMLEEIIKMICASRRDE